MERIVFLTGRLAEANLRRVLAGIEQDDPTTAFEWEVREIGLQVAALMTADMVKRRVQPPLSVTGADGIARPADRVIVPGRCRGDVEGLGDHFGIPVIRGPEELKDLPRFFNRAAKPIDLNEYRVAIFAEIVDAPRLTVDQVVERALAFAADGANVIDIGCLPATPFPHMEDCVRAVKAAGLEVSVDSMLADELLRAGRAGADYLLSLKQDTLWIADECESVPVLIAQDQADMSTLYAAIDAMEARGKSYLADPILDPIPFGFTASIVRYHALRARYPEAPIMMGIGNLTELTEADTSGINALLFGICAELDVAAVLATQVSLHARRAVAEADVARRVMHAAQRHQQLPKGLSEGLATVHARHPFPDTAEEIAVTAAQVKDPNFRVQIAPEGLHVYNRDGLRVAQDAFALWPRLKLEDDAAHAFYMGVELARAETAWQLGKRYVQDQPLDWGVAVKRGEDDKDGWCAPGTTLAHGREDLMSNDLIFEAVITTLDADGKPHVAPFGVRYRGSQVLLKPFRPSATLDHVRARGNAVLNLTTDTRVFASAVCARWLGGKPLADDALELVATRYLPGQRLAGAHALAHSELKLVHDDDDAERPTLTLDRVHDATHAPFRGFNRAQAAVLEAAVLVSRLQMLPAAKVDTEMAYLQIAIDKTASETEHEAWRWLRAAIAAQRAGTP